MVQLGPWPKGMNNRAESHSLPDGTLRNIVNADIDNTGKARRRRGMTKVYSCLLPKGGFSCPAGAYFIEQGAIKKFIAGSVTDIYQGLIGTEYAWYYHNGIVYFSDGNISLKIKNDVANFWGMPEPGQPMIYGTSGSYGSGQYLAAVSYVDINGVESGSSQIVSATLPDNTGIIFGNLSSPTDSQVVSIRLYLSMPNGSELYHIADVAPGTIDYTITAGRYDNSNILEHAHVSPAPAGRIIRFYNGRAFIADAFGNVWYSDPLEPDHFRLSTNVEHFPQVVDIMEPVTRGIFFAYGNQTDFYAGNVEDGFNITKKFDYGGVFGTGKMEPNSANVVWQSQRGMIIGASDGSCKNIQEEQIAVESAVSGATLIREKNGLRQYVAILHQPTTSPMAATSWIDAEVIRRS